MHMCPVVDSGIRSVKLWKQGLTTNKTGVFAMQWKHWWVGPQHYMIQQSCAKQSMEFKLF